MGNHGPERKPKLPIQICRKFNRKRMFEYLHKQRILDHQRGSGGNGAVRQYTTARDELFGQLTPDELAELDVAAEKWNRDGPDEEFKAQ